MSDQHIFPLGTEQRIISLDILRGFAVLGILIMNIQSFSMISAAYINPSAYGDLSGINKWVWILSHTFADLKFMTLFSILFGAGILLFTQRIEQRGLESVGLHYRRMFWLLIFGMMHAYLLWYGDILVAYAICGALVILFRKLKPRTLLIVGLITLMIPSLLYILFGLMISFFPAEAMQGISISWQSTPELIQKELMAYRGGWLDQMDQRLPSTVFFQTSLFLMMTSWRAGGLMLIGMALFKWGILNNTRSRALYVQMALIGLFCGLVLILYGIVKNFAAEWVVEYSMFHGSQFNYWGSLGVATGYIGMVMLFSKSGAQTWLGNSLAAAGRMAFSNYILQTLLCTFIFYGHGLGLFGSVSRLGQILIVLAIWVLQLILSPLWLRYFRYGPLERLWRSLTYWKWRQI